MPPAEYHATFSNSHNHGLQVGNNAGKIETAHHHYPVERPETPSSPILLIPFGRDPDFVDRGTILHQLHHRYAAPGSRTALVGLGGVGWPISLGEAARKWADGDEQLCELGFASNTRTKAEIGRELGWTPKKTRADWEQSIVEEFRELLKKIKST
ncbi:hypothetical protein TSTA_019160 [Talaromyces stipitatus ATCC 10500]|uniref:Fungal death-pathway protein SesB domain-containing protein n=1 Tax=Talaromyces stipitatus (strain ATCC 10500 / CBS 375.48 / QM 6759 / NRRL 1006) TaxID=441959 RepID=B8MH40_TALSN|nr:uncharacterized protein TSTA_019160 [Talaromyces stipitatus ATCC 10500]EED16854.1 hypothetical protein TSTA_019160 [Talaromyces stipitatus ATCC 10500]